MESEQREKTKEPRTFAGQAERSLKEAKRLIKGAGAGDADGTMAEMDEARVLAMLELAEAIRSKN
jgi:hypothetical protein